MSFQWASTPPPPERIQTDWREVARLLRSRPGVWAVIYEGRTKSAANYMANQIRRGRKSALTPTREFEAEQRGTLVYARWIGAEKAAIAERLNALRAI